MTTEANEKLVRMALEIHQFFKHQGDGAIDAAANHLKQFWAPSMRTAFIRMADRNTGSLPEEAVKIAMRLKEI